MKPISQMIPTPTEAKARQKMTYRICWGTVVLLLVINLPGTVIFNVVYAEKLENVSITCLSSGGDILKIQREFIPWMSIIGGFLPVVVMLVLVTIMIHRINVIRNQVNVVGDIMEENRRISVLLIVTVVTFTLLTIPLYISLSVSVANNQVI